MPLVVDASVALAWALPDESSDYADAVLAVVERDGLRVPELWAREIANGIAVAYRRKRITSADEQESLAALSHLSIDVEEAAPALTVVRNGTAAATRYGLMAYDAAYVESCLAGATDACHSRHSNAQGCRTIRGNDFPAIKTERGRNSRNTRSSGSADGSGPRGSNSPTAFLRGRSPSRQRIPFSIPA